MPLPRDVDLGRGAVPAWKYHGGGRLAERSSAQFATPGESRSAFQYRGSKYRRTPCPACGALVYFVRPAGGGKIWVEEMGRPWPKHPCFDDEPSLPRAARRRGSWRRIGDQLLADGDTAGAAQAYLRADADGTDERAGQPPGGLRGAPPRPAPAAPDPGALALQRAAERERRGEYADALGWYLASVRAGGQSAATAAERALALLTVPRNPVPRGGRRHGDTGTPPVKPERAHRAALELGRWWLQRGGYAAAAGAFAVVLSTSPRPQEGRRQLRAEIEAHVAALDATAGAQAWHALSAIRDPELADTARRAHGAWLERQQRTLEACDVYLGMAAPADAVDLIRRSAGRATGPDRAGVLARIVQSASQSARRQLGADVAVAVAPLLLAAGDTGAAAAAYTSAVQRGRRRSRDSALAGLWELLPAGADDPAAAPAVYRAAAGSGSDELAAAAVVALGPLLHASGDLESAVSVCCRVLRVRPEPRVEERLQQLLERLAATGDREACTAALWDLTTCPHTVHGARAGLLLGAAMTEQADQVRARRAYSAAAQGRWPHEAAVAEVRLGAIEESEGASGPAADHYLRAFAAPFPEPSAEARRRLRSLLERPAEAGIAPAVVERAEHLRALAAAPELALLLAVQLTAGRHWDLAATVLGIGIEACDSNCRAGSGGRELIDALAQGRISEQTLLSVTETVAAAGFDAPAVTALALGDLLLHAGHHARAVALYQTAAASPRTAGAARAGLARAQRRRAQPAPTPTRAGPSRPDEGAVQRAAAAGCAERGLIDEAATTYLQVMNSGHPEHGPWAALELGEMLAGIGKTAAARAAYRRAAASSHLEAARRARAALAALG